MKTIKQTTRQEFDSSKELVKGGRRNWEGRMWNSFREGESYCETDDAEYRKCVENFGEFYCAISRAAIDDLSEKVNFRNKGTYKVNLITYVQAKKDAAEYTNTYAKNNDFISCLPCGAAMDCVFEEIYECFEKEVESIQKNDESKYDA